MKIRNNSVSFGKIISKLLKYIIYAIILAIYLIIFFRSFMSCDIPLSKEILKNDKFLKAYEQEGENFKVLQYGMKDAYIKIADGRLLYFDKLYYIPLVNQLQLTVKYNTDIAEYDFNEEIPFRFYLKDENNENYELYDYKFKTRFQYGYIRLCFENVSLTESGEIPTSDSQDIKRYTLFIELIDKDGIYNPLASYRIYSGSLIYKEIDIK